MTEPECSDGAVIKDWLDTGILESGFEAGLLWDRLRDGCHVTADGNTFS